ncbi:ABC transporter ATP-binding protein [Lysinibacillus sp. 54212]|uniref:ABC transporter ATP-binding protein n=1 Tax=Lysinibacillus sp. 54212 TaxID=3119829 RepID=UPI002FCA38A8
MLRLTDVSFQYTLKKVLKDVSIQFPIGQLIGVIGENGSGKSTLLKLMAGVLRANQGEITCKGKSVSRRQTNEIAYMPDTDLFYEFYTGEQLFKFFATQYSDFSYDKACIVSQFLQVDRKTKLKHLSKGNRGRIKMAATLGREVSYYIMDEPFAGLDPIAREMLIKGLIRFTDIENQTIILSTHEVNEVEPILDQILLLQHGSIVAYEGMEDIRYERNEDAVQWMKSLYEEKVK